MDVGNPVGNSPPRSPSAEHAAAIGRFYDEHADAFAQVCGDVIQAFRTKDVTHLLDYEANAMRLAPGMKLLDAGCGVAGPAIHFAQQYGVSVDALTVSAVQAQRASEKIAAAGVADRVTVRVGDFHAPDELQPESYDVVCFLESFGHSDDQGRAIASAWTMLMPGGRLYIKDLFIREALTPDHAAAIDANIRRIKEAYHYDVADLYDVIRHLRRSGFILSAVKTVDIPLEEFENLTISNEFQELTGINRIDDLSAYTFPVDFFEVIAIKPWYQKGAGLNRDFLQNLYEMRIEGVAPDRL